MINSRNEFFLLINNNKGINKAMLESLSQTLNYLLSLCKDLESANNYNSLYQDLLKNKELEPDIFMAKIEKYSNLNLSI